MTDSDYYILTLAAIARELNVRRLTSASVHIAAGLPLTWVSEQKDSFKAYLLQHEAVDFSFRGVSYHVEFAGADIFPQGFSAVADRLRDFRGVNMLCDIGNGTMNVMYINECRPLAKKCFTELTNAVKVAISAVAEALETIRAHMVVLQYHLLHNQAEIKDITGRINWNQLLVNEYQSVKRELKEKQAKKKELLTQKKDTGIFNPIRHIQFNQQITTLAEEIEELKTRRNHLMCEVGCQNETEMKEAEGTLSKMSNHVKKLTAQQETLANQLTADEAQYRETEANVVPEQAGALLDARISLRSGFRDPIRTKLREMFWQRFQYDWLSSAEEQVDARLGENSDLFQERTVKLRHEQKMEQRRNQPKLTKNKTMDHER